MSWGGKQHRHCPNCGRPLYDVGLTMDHVKSLMCGGACRKEWELKYARMLLGQDAGPAREAYERGDAKL